MLFRSVAILGAAAMAAAGCGGDDGGGDDGATRGDDGGATQTSGESVFASNCASCHGPSGTGGNVGPSLEASSDQEFVEQQVRNGGGGMPAFEGQLSDAEITAVSEYVTTEIAGG